MKEHIDAEITNCVFDDNEIAIRARGPDSRSGAHVTVKDCAVYHMAVAVRTEDKIEHLEIVNLAFGPGVKARFEFHKGKDLQGFKSTGERDAPDIRTFLTCQ